MLRKLIVSIVINITLYASIYLFYSFIEWQFENPFKWIINFSTYSTWKQIRLSLLLFWWFVLILAATGIFEKTKQENKK